MVVYGASYGSSMTVSSLIGQSFILPVICILAGQFHRFRHKASLYQGMMGV